MLTFLFWNMGGRTDEAELPRRARGRYDRLASILANLVARHAIDLLIVAECPLEAGEVLAAFNRGAHEGPFRAPDPRTNCERVVVFPRLPVRFLRLREETDKFTCRELCLPGRPPVTFFAVHFGSKLFKDDESQAQAMPGFSGLIRDRERRQEHDRTVVVGDLNMNPFETGMVSAEGLNAVMSREVAARGSRTVDFVSYPYFYNPMWSHFGDSTHELFPPGSDRHEPPGTCYYGSSRSKWFFWNMFDQVLLRPSLLDAFRNDSLRILVTDGERQLANERGLPDRVAVADHFPIVFQLNI
jgi:hypothetical protein